MPNIIEKLSEAFQKFPGIGPRQAKRFVFSILEKDESFAKNFASLVHKLQQEIIRCPSCFYVFEVSPNLPNLAVAPPSLCPVCRDENREKNILLVVQKEIDLENIEKSRCYNGKYFTLGNALSLLKKDGGLKTIRMRELFERIKNDREIKEIILAFNADREGDATAVYIGKILEPFIKQRGLKITRFGKGLSSGTEIEYSDKDTIQNAFLNRK